MAKKILSDDDQKTLGLLAAAGTTPEDLAARFHISVSSVHNYKNILKASGLQLPVVRGKRPSHRYTTGNLPVSDRSLVLLQAEIGGDPTGVAVLPQGGAEQTKRPGYVIFHIRGLSVQVDANASLVRVENGEVYID